MYQQFQKYPGTIKVCEVLNTLKRTCPSPRMEKTGLDPSVASKWLYDVASNVAAVVEITLATNPSPVTKRGGGGRTH